MAYNGKYSSVRTVKRRLGIALLVAAVLTTGACSKKETASQAPAGGPDIEHLNSFGFAADTLLPGSIEAYDLTRPSPPVVVRPDSLGNYQGIDDSLYLDFNVIGLASAEYVVKGVPIKAEIAQCTEPQDAYGLYSQFRPDGQEVGDVGDESFELGGTRYMVRGPYFITVRVLDAADSTSDAASLLAQEIISRLGTQPRMPAFFILFPSSDKIPSSTRYYAYRFLGIPGIDQVFTTDYLVQGDTVTLFLALDESGLKFLKMKEFAADHGETIDVPRIFEFDSGYSLYFDNPELGKVIAGLARQKLVGAVPYDSRTEEHKVASWVKGLQQ